MSPTQQAQEKICNFFREMAITKPPRDVLLKFKQLFIDYAAANDSQKDLIEALSRIILNGGEEGFIYTLKRCCYILIKNWYAANTSYYIYALIELFLDPEIADSTQATKLGLLRDWLFTFTKSEDYWHLSLYKSIISRQNSILQEPFLKPTQEQFHWSCNYASYLLSLQYANAKNPPEQRQVAEAIARKLRNQFKLDLAVYISHSQSSFNKEKTTRNPTNLGYKVLYLIKIILTQWGASHYKESAHEFLTEIRNIKFDRFKQKLLNYLVYTEKEKDSEVSSLLLNEISQKLGNYRVNNHNQIIDETLIFKTCRQIVRFLTFDERSYPSDLFLALTGQGNHLTLAIVLLKLVLACELTYPYLETHIGALIRYYVRHPEQKHVLLTNFLEILDVVFAVFADNNHQYSIVKMTDSVHNENDELDEYRVFSRQIM